jgi:hypothetical protein
MAEAAKQLTRIDDLGDLLRYLTVELGYSKGVAVFMMNERYSAGDLPLEKQDCIRDGEPYGGWIAIDAKFGNLKLDRKGHVQVDPQIKLWREARYRIAKGCDVRALWPPRPLAGQAAHSPDSFKPLAAQRQPTKVSKPADAGRNGPGRPSPKPLVVKEIERLKKSTSVDDSNILKGKRIELWKHLASVCGNSGFNIEPKSIGSLIRRNEMLPPQKR